MMPGGFTLEELARCAVREVGQRKRVYGRLVEQGKWKQERADREIAMMQAIADHFMAQQQPGLFDGTDR